MDDVLVAIDVGYGETKIARADLGVPVYMSFRSIAAAIYQETAAVGDDIHKRDTRRVLADGTPYEVGRDAILIKTTPDIPVLHDDFIETPEYEAYFHAALLASQQRHITHLVTGLPVSHMNLKAELCQRLRGHHQVTPEISVEVDNVHVIPQPIGALLDRAVGEQQGHAPIKGLTVLVVDPGHYTTDWLLAERFRGIASRSDSISTGVQSFLEMLQQILNQRHGRKPRTLMLGEDLKAGRSVRVAGEVVEDSAAVIEEAARRVIAPVMGGLKNKVGNLDDIDLVLLVGGGASLFRPVLEQVFADTGIDVVIPHAPGFANVRGYYTYGEKIRAGTLRAER